MQEVAQVEQVSLDYDQEGHGQKHKDQHVYCEFWKIHIYIQTHTRVKREIQNVGMWVAIALGVWYQILSYNFKIFKHFFFFD